MCVCLCVYTSTLFTHTHKIHICVIVRAGEGGSESAVLRNRFAGEWRTILGEQCYLTGVHYLAVSSPRTHTLMHTHRHRETERERARAR